MNIQYINTPYSKGSTVSVNVASADASVTVQNDLTNSSSQISGTGESDIGSVTNFGVFRQTFVDSQGAVDCLLLVSASDCVVVQSPLPQESTDLIKRFFGAVTTARAETAWTAWDKEAFLAENVVTLTSAVGFTVACAYSFGFGAAACVVASDEVKDVFLNAGVAYLLKLVEVMTGENIFTPDELKDITETIKQDHELITLINVEGLADAIAAMASIVIDHEVSNPDIKLLLTLQKDLFGKYHTIWKVLKAA